SISIWEDLTTHFLAQFFPSGRTAKIRNDIFKIDRAASCKLRDKNAEEYWEIIENLALYDHEGWDDSRDFAKPVKAISLPQNTVKTPNQRLFELEDQISYLIKGSRTTPETSSTHAKEINDRMAEMFGLLKELTASRTPEKVLVREEAIHPVTKNVNAISFVKMEKEKNAKNNKKEVENRTDNEAIRSMKEEITGEGTKELVEMPRSQPIGYYLKHEINKELIEGLIGNQRYNDSLLSTRLGITEDVLVEIASYVYPVDFMILDVMEDKKKPFILGTPLLTIAKVEIRFDKGTITLKSGKNKINFFKIHESPRRVEVEIKNDIDPVAPTNTISRLILEWEERIKLHQEREMEFNQWRSKSSKKAKTTEIGTKETHQKAVKDRRCSEKAMCAMMCRVTDKNKRGFGYNAVPSPHPLILNRPTPLDLSYSGLEEFQQPEINWGIKPAIGFMKPFGCHVTILNTLDKLGKFDGKSDEGFFVGYSLSSKAFRVYNIRTRIVQENLHVGFLENKPMLEGNGPKWLFDLDSLTQTMNYVPVVAGSFSNVSAGMQEGTESNISSQKDQDCIFMPIWKDASYFEDITPQSVDDVLLQGQDGNHDDSSFQDDGIDDHQVNTASPQVNTASPQVNTGSRELSTADNEVSTANI
ncbi:MAK10-like protein, partial [Tanacetum coccineum]